MKIDDKSFSDAVLDAFASLKGRKVEVVFNDDGFDIPDMANMTKGEVIVCVAAFGISSLLALEQCLGDREEAVAVWERLVTSTIDAEQATYMDENEEK